LRKIALVPLKEIKDTTEIEKVIRSNANAILFIIPKNMKDALVDEIQNYLQKQTIYLPIYFVNENEQINDIVQQLKEEYEQSTGEKVIIFFI
jgi:nucleoside-triphosphatase THEP1